MAKVTMSLGNGFSGRLTPDKIVRDKVEIARELNKNLIIKLLDDPNFQGDLTNAPGRMYMFDKVRNKWTEVHESGSGGTDTGGHLHTNKNILDQIDWDPNYIGNTKKLLTVEQSEDNITLDLIDYKEGLPKKPDNISEDAILINSNGEAKWSEFTIPSHITTYRTATVDSHLQIELLEPLFNIEIDQVLVFSGMLIDIQEGALSYENGKICVQLDDDSVDVGDELGVLVIKNSITNYGKSLSEMENKVFNISSELDGKIEQVEDMYKEQNLKIDGITDMEKQINTLNQTINILTNRISELEKTVNDNNNIVGALVDRNSDKISSNESRITSLENGEYTTQEESTSGTSSVTVYDDSDYTDDK